MIYCTCYYAAAEYTRYSWSQWFQHVSHHCDHSRWNTCFQFQNKHNKKCCSLCILDDLWVITTQIKPRRSIGRALWLANWACSPHRKPVDKLSSDLHLEWTARERAGRAIPHKLQCTDFQKSFPLKMSHFFTSLFLICVCCVKKNESIDNNIPFLWTCIQIAWGRCEKSTQVSFSVKAQFVGVIPLIEEGVCTTLIIQKIS